MSFNINKIIPPILKLSAVKFILFKIPKIYEK